MTYPPASNAGSPKQIPISTRQTHQQLIPDRAYFSGRRRTWLARAVGVLAVVTTLSTVSTFPVLAIEIGAADTIAPTTPANLTATRSGSTIDLAWSTSIDNTGVAGYTITRNGVLITTALNPFYNDTSMAPGSYTYSVVAFDEAGNISTSSTPVTVTVPLPPANDTTAPTVPTGLVTTVVGATVGLSWTPSIDNTAVSGYRVIRNGVLRGTTNDTTFVESGLAAGTYSYSVAAFDAGGNVSATSTSVSATVAASTPLSFLTPAVLPGATLGQPYLGYIVVSDPPGPSDFRYTLVSGKVPPGTRFVKNTLPQRPEARVIGTPTKRGTFSFTVDVRDGTGAVVRRTFSLAVR